jgi:hypothetical protein
VALLLIGSLYRLKQAGRLWNQFLHEKLQGAGYRQTKTDICVYVKRDDDEVTIVGVYVDDLLVTGSSTKRVDEFGAHMASLEIKRLGPVSKFLGARVRQHKNGFAMDQEESINDILMKFGLADSHPLCVPISPEDESPSESPPLSDERKEEGTATIKDFQSLVGSLLWVARAPDLTLHTRCTAPLAKVMRHEWRTGTWQRGSPGT